MLGQLHLIRAFEETVLELAGEGLVHGPAHSSIGQEGGAVGSIVGLRSTDAVNGSHRGHHQFLAKALTHVTKGSLDLDALVTPEVAEVLQRTLAEILGLAQGYCGGRGGSMHLQWFEAGALGTNAIVGGGVPMAAGQRLGAAALPAGPDGSDLTVTYFGDGAVNIGSVLESLNLAVGVEAAGLLLHGEQRLRRLHHRRGGHRRAPAVGPGPRLRHHRLAGRRHGPARGAPGHGAGRRPGCAPGEGPVVVEALVYRFFHQNGPYPGSAFGYRTKEEEAEWRARDPLDRVAREMTRLGLIDEAGVAAVRAQAVEAMRAAAARARRARPGARRAKAGRRGASAPSCGPTRRSSTSGSAATCRSWPGRGPPSARRSPGRLRRGKFIDAVAAVMDRRMGADPRIVVLGEDVHKLAGGTNGATKGLAAKYPGRVLGTPISENAFAGLGGGLALDGRFRPVVEFMYPDFLWVAADQVFNQIGKARHMFGGRNPVPLVLRTKVAMGSGYGSQHLMDPAGIFATSARLADHGRVHPVRLRRADERGPRGRRPGARCSSTSTCTGPRARSRSTTWTTRSRSARRRCAGPGSEVTVLTLPVDGGARGGGDRAHRGRRRADRPAVPRPGLARLGDRRRVGQEDQRGADRRAGHARAPPTAAGWPTRCSAGSSTGSTSRCSG